MYSRFFLWKVPSSSFTISLSLFESKILDCLSPFFSRSSKKSFIDYFKSSPDILASDLDGGITKFFV
jgi:hypothetical protein